MSEVGSKLLDYFNGDELAANVWKSKYATEGEETPDDMHRRLAKEFAKIEDKYKKDEHESYYVSYPKISEYGQTRNWLTEESIYQLFKDFKYIVPQGSIMSTLGTDTIASLSNCWVVESPLDSYSSILRADGHLAYYYKRRGGVGTDISNLRPKNTATNNTSKSSTGAVSFMHRFSNTTREVAMNGRRGALMISIDINHPDVMDFIKVKRDGVSVTGANISIKLNNEFMKAVENNEDYILRFPVDQDLSYFSKEYLWEETPYNELTYLEDHKRNNEVFYVKKIKAKEYWDEIVKSARNYAEPGLMYWDNVIDNDPAAVYPQYKPITSNPCGEQFLNANDSCRLMVLNLFSFVKEPFTKDAYIDYEELYKISYEHCRLGDDLIDLELEYIQRIIDKIKSDPEPDNIKRDELELWETSYKNTKAGRRIGLGITALADMLAALNLKYDSDEALEEINLVMNTKMRAELDCSIDLAILRGTFDGWDGTKEFLDSRHSLYLIKGKNKFYQFILEEFPERSERMYEYGRRNISWSTIAPTGTTSLMTQTTSGCEPLFLPFYMRRKKINPNEEGVRVDFVDEIGDSWQEFPVLHPKFKEWIWITYDEPFRKIDLYSKEELQRKFEESPWYKSTANDINWQKRNKVQSILQKYTTNAISSTINLPSSVTEKEVSDIYFNGWKLGLKGQTVYVDGSRSGVLVSDTKPNKELFEHKDAPKRPKELDAEAHIVSVKGIKYSVFVGIYDGKPYEVFAYPGIAVKGEGLLIKQGKASYDFIQIGSSNSFNVCITDKMTEEEATITRLISTSLRHGANIKFIVEQLNKGNGDITSFIKAIARVLKKYIPDGETAKLKCEECGSTEIIFEEGCSKCKSCGSSKCG